METKNFLGLEGLNHFWEKAKIWIINEITTKIAGIVLSSVPTGTILHGMWKSAPKGFLLCNGATYPTSQYPKLASVLGATGSTFQVPDLRNRTVMGANPDVGGWPTGNKSNVGDVQDSQLPSITGHFSTGFRQAWEASGAFQLSNSSGPRASVGNTDQCTAHRSWFFNSSIRDASYDHEGRNVYVNYGEVRSANIRMNYIIKY